MKKVLIITYYWPPKGGVGVQRWLKLSRHLSDSNYKPIIYTSKGGSYSIYDSSLTNSIPKSVEVISKNIFEPQSLFNLFFNKKVSSDYLIRKKHNLFSKILIWLRSNLFIPDTRSLWISPSINFLENYLKKNKIDCIISTGPPHSMHLIALELKKRHSFKWIADFRDPWTGIEYFNKLPLLTKSRLKHSKLESNVLKQADIILSVSNSWANSFQALGAKKTHVITNGYDISDYIDLPTRKDTGKFIIGHFGLYNELRDHSMLWDVINEIKKDVTDFTSKMQFLFAGELYSGFFTKMKEKKLFNYIEFYSNLPHSEAICKMRGCDILLVTQSDTIDALGRLPAKFFEYLAIRKPIIAIGKKGSDLEKIMKNISYCWFIEFKNKILLRETILHIYKTYNQDIKYHDNIDVFSRKNQSKELIKLIDSIC